jgi:hypothetical protein
MRALANGLGAELQFEHDSLGVCARIKKDAASKLTVIHDE